mgnify:CR=1 FL=1
MDFFGQEKIIIPERGDLLISEPYLNDPNFSRTVIIVCENNENGSLGFVLNNTSKLSLGDVVESTALYHGIYFDGDPVEKDTIT